MTENLQQKVQQWFIDRNLQEANPVQQFHKLIEEYYLFIRTRRTNCYITT